MRVFLLLTGLVVLSVGCGTAVSPTETPPAYQITSTKPADQITITPGDGVVVFDVFSESGIGRAEMRLTDGRWPDQVDIRLHLRGLESLTLAYGAVVVQTAVSSSGDHAISQTVQTAGQPPAATEGTPYAMPLTVAGGDGPIVIPLKEGYFAMQLPPDFTAGDYTAFTLNWIDFYR